VGNLALLEVRHLQKDFGGLVALNDLSFTIDEGEIVGLIGANGAGKSTVFNIITGLIRLTSGSVIFEGKDITGLKPHDVVKLGISRTFQSVRPFLNYSVEENVRVGALFGRTKSPQVDEKVEEVLRITGLEAKKSAPVSSLPIEQRKLVEVARALASSPRLLMMDEPMAGLNSVETGDFIELIRKVNSAGVTVLVVEHVMKAIMTLSRRVVVLHAGQKLAEGSPESILANEEVIGVYLGEAYAKS
jgi:branched-chain amino acid transport system ATP-binding protein